MPKPKASSSHTPPEGMQINPFFQTPFMVFAAIKDEKISCVASRILALAIIADHGYGKVLKLGIDRVIAGTKCGRKTAINGLKALVDNGFLVKIDEHQGLYKLGPLFDKFIPIEEVVTVDDVRDDEDMPQSLVESLLAAWNELVEPSKQESGLDGVAKKRANQWAGNRVRAGADPVIDFKIALEYFLAHGHEHPRENAKPRNPMAYNFKGFLRVCHMFLNIAQTVEAGVTQSASMLDENETAFTQVSGSITKPAENRNIGIPEKYAKFIKMKDEDGKFQYRESEIVSVEELALVYEHAFEQFGIPTAVRGNKTAIKKCAEDFEGLLKGADAHHVIHMVAVASDLFKNDHYWQGKPYNFHTARSKYSDALVTVGEITKVRNERKRLRQKYHDDIQNVLVNIAECIADISENPDPAHSDFSEQVEELENYLHDYAAELEQEFGRPDAGDLPQRVVDGIRCFSTLGVLTPPESLLEAIGTGPWEPSFDWLEDITIPKSVSLCNTWLDKNKNGSQKPKAVTE